MGALLCGEAQREALVRLLSTDAIANTFLLADIELYGFDKPYQKVWMNSEVTKPAVYLLFYDNLSIWAPNAAHTDAALVHDILANHPVGCIMGRLETISPLSALFPQYRLHQKIMCAGNAPLPPGAENEKVQIATMADVDDIFFFLASIPKLAGMYASRDMIADRIERADGIHAIIRKNGRIIAHANTSASSALATMIGGAAVAAGEDEELLATVLHVLCRNIKSAGKTPCSLCEKDDFARFWVSHGFTNICDWATLTKTPG